MDAIRDDMINAGADWVDEPCVVDGNLISARTPAACAMHALTLDHLTGGRVVLVTSTASFYGRVDFADLMGERDYDRWRAYGQSKLANLLFARGLIGLSAATVSTLTLAEPLTATVTSASRCLCETVWRAPALMICECWG